MIAAALKSLQWTINSYLKLDPDTVARLNEYQGKTIQINISDWRIQLNMTIAKDAITLSEFINLPDTIISGTLNNLFCVAMAKGDNRALFTQTINIDGDIELGQTMRSIWQRMDIDWEEHLSKITGDAVAHQITQVTQKIKNGLTQVATSIRQSCSDFIQREARYCPPKQALSDFYHDVSKLRDDVDRLEMTIKIIKND